LTALAVALLLTAQVHVDTVIRLQYMPSDMVYVESNNELLVYDINHDSLHVIDCDEYSVKKAIPLGAGAGVPAYWAWNWQRNKYYFVLVRPKFLAVFDPACDSFTRWLPLDGARSPCYVSTHDCVYVVDDTVMRVIDCATDTFVRNVPPAVYRPWGVSWDSVGDKVYTTAVGAPSEDVLLAYSCVNDSLVAAVSTGIFYPAVLAYCPTLHKAYLGSDWATDYIAVYDCEGDSVTRVLPIRYEGHGFARAGYSEARRRLYVLSTGITDTLCTLDCVTDSIISRTTLPRNATGSIIMAERTDRLYVSTAANRVMVFDCEADTLLGPGIKTGPPGTLAYDSTHSRVFVLCGDSSIYVLADDTTGVAERRRQSPALWDVAISPNPAKDRAVIRWQVPVDAEVSFCVYNTAGQLVKVLADGKTKPGTYTSVWSRTDARGRRLANGVYFCTLAAENQRFSRKVILTE
jgi:DNA-binding beta-propeller fold protein YncE